MNVLHHFLRLLLAVLLFCVCLHPEMRTVSCLKDPVLLGLAHRLMRELRVWPIHVG